MKSTELSEIKEDIPLVNHMKISRLDDSLFSKDLAPHYMQLASKLASSELVPKSFRGKPQDLFICWAMGYQIGLSPEQSMQCIAVINGKPAMWGDDMLALCMAHKDFEDIEEVAIKNKDSTVTGYICTVWRKDKKPKSNEFTLDMAKRAGLLAKGGVWTQYPERMLKLRARGFSLRDTFPDALKGIKPREEVEDYIDAEYKVVSENSSRTEFLKQDLLTKKGEMNEILNKDSDMVLHEKNENSTEKDNVESFLNEMGETGEEKGKVTREAVLAGPITAEQISEIEKLLEEKGYTEERILKAMKYYEVENIAMLPEASAIHFIQKLQKS